MFISDGKSIIHLSLRIDELVSRLEIQMNLPYFCSLAWLSQLSWMYYGWPGELL